MQWPFARQHQQAEAAAMAYAGAQPADWAAADIPGTAATAAARVAAAQLAVRPSADYLMQRQCIV